jgi:hypothetical protein
LPVDVRQGDFPTPVSRLILIDNHRLSLPGDCAKVKMLCQRASERLREVLSDSMCSRGAS